MKYECVQKATVDVRYLRAKCGVRYWEDATVNGQEDSEGTLIPLRSGDLWCVEIDLETGGITGWPAGTSAEIHYKVCDDGEYSLLLADGQAVAWKSGYVPSMLCPKGNGYGDYVIINVGPDGVIEGWRADLSYFSDDEC